MKHFNSTQISQDCKKMRQILNFLLKKIDVSVKNEELIRQKLFQIC